MTAHRTVMTPDARRAAIVYAAMLAAAASWIGLLFLAPALLAAGRLRASALVYGAFSKICHQLPERSFHWHGFPLGVCSRCTAIYLGVGAGLLLAPLLRPLHDETFPDRRLLLLSALPLAIDFAGGFSGLFANTFFSRSITGGLFGLVAAFYLLPGMVAFAAKRAREY